MTLDELREKIDDTDRQIVELLKQRSHFVHEVGQIKKTADRPVFVPERECDMHKKLMTLNQGVLPEKSLQSIYRQIVSCSFLLEGGMRIGYLGPEGTWSHQAALARFGESVEYFPFLSFEDTFDAVERGVVDYGVIPVENSTDGSVSQAMDLFAKTGLQICAQTHQTVKNCLIANVEEKEIRTIYSHPQVLGQCHHWLQRYFPMAALVPVSSTAVAAHRAQQEAEQGAAALGSEMTANLYHLQVLQSNIQDRADNMTRFVIIGKQDTQPTGQDRTTICFTVAHQAGSLVDVLQYFRNHKINLFNIGSRPTRDTAWEYVFYIDVEGHQKEEPLRTCIEDLKKHCPIFKVLGSYPEI